MKKSTIAALMLMAGLWGFGACTQQEASQEQGITDTENVTDKAYICPMNCEGSGSNEPGKCPVCGMDVKKNPHFVVPPVSPSADPTQKGTIDPEGNR